MCRLSAWKAVPLEDPAFDKELADWVLSGDLVELDSVLDPPADIAKPSTAEGAEATAEPKRECGSRKRKLRGN